MFATFPDGISGLGLLILRSALGVALVLRSSTCLRNAHDANPVVVIFILLIVTSALLITAGYRTRVAAVVAILAIVAAMGLCSEGSVSEELDIRTTEVFAIVIAAAIACLGPGVFSLDSRLFGRREIVIPKSPHRN